jgi:UDP-N-acetyl-D-glucosamine dehydrogenase
MEIDDIIAKVKQRDIRIGVIGLGYVGLPLALEFAKAGFKVTGFEKNPEKVEKLNNAESYVSDVNSLELKKEKENGRLAFVAEPGKLGEMDAIIICVPTPLVKTKDPDLSFIISAAGEIGAHLRRGQLIVLESTTYPGTTEEVVLPIFEETGLKVGVDFFLAFSPERIDPGNKIYSIRNTPKVVGGTTKECSRLAQEIYSSVAEQVVCVSSTKTAEMVKLLENTFRAVNIGLVNEITMICEKLGINVWEVIDAAATKPFGFIPFYPGPGLGGHCIPVDSQYLAWKMRVLNYKARFIDLAEEINTSMPAFVVSKTMDSLNLRKKSLNGSRILVLGIAYKKNIDDIRESPALDIIDRLLEKGAVVSYNEPFIPMSHEYRNISNSELSATILNESDCVIICTNHDQYDYQWIVDQAPLILDCRNATKDISTGVEKIIRL